MTLLLSTDSTAALGTAARCRSRFTLPEALFGLSLCMGSSAQAPRALLHIADVLSPTYTNNRYVYSLPFRAGMVLTSPCALACEALQKDPP